HAAGHGRVGRLSGAVAPRRVAAAAGLARRGRVRGRSAARRGVRPHPARNDVGGLMGAIAELLGDDRPVVGDGAIGTMLQAAGLMPGASPEVWNVEHPERMQVIHSAYADAGARLLTTNTFGGTRPRLALHGHEQRVHELNEA